MEKKIGGIFIFQGVIYVQTRSGNNPAVVGKMGSQVTVESPAGVKYNRNVAHVRKYYDAMDEQDYDDSGANDELRGELGQAIPDELGGEEAIELDEASENDNRDRPVRNCHPPARFNDYIMN